MEIENKEMYHFHKHDVYDEMWVQNNELIVDDNFESNFFKSVYNFTPTVDGEDYEDLVREFINDRDNARYSIYGLVNEALDLIKRASLFNRELALENIRKEYYSSLPSRRHSIWVTDKAGLLHWKKVFLDSSNPYEYSIFKVSLTGNLFKSCDSLIPDRNLTHEEMLKLAHDYWNPNAEALKGDDVEYLFQGKVKILKSLKMR